MSEEKKKCQCGRDIRPSVSHNQNCEALFSPDPLASIAESLEKIANPMQFLTSPLSESEKFFRHLNNGEVELVPTIAYDSSVATSPFTFRITITPKGEGK